MEVPGWLNFQKCLPMCLLKMRLGSVEPWQRKKKISSVSRWKAAGSLSPGSAAVILTGHTESRGWFSWAKQYLDLWSSTEFLCVERTGNVPSPPPSKLLSAVWKPPTSHCCTRTDTRKVNTSHRERNAAYTAAQDRSESCGLAHSAPNHSYPSAPGLPSFCVLTHGCNASWPTAVLNFLQRT